MKIAIVASHPVQYEAHLFRRLSREPGMDLTVCYGHQPTSANQAQAGFGAEFSWDLDLVSGYQSIQLRNVSQRPNVHSWSGIDTPEVARVVREGRFDAVVLMGWWNKGYWQALWGSLGSRTPVLARSDSTLTEQTSRLRKAAKYGTHPLFLSRLSACLAVGSRSASYFRHYGVKSERIFLVPHSVDDSLFGRSGCQGVNRQEARQKYGLTPSKICFLFCGKFIPIKRPLDFIHSLAIAGQANPNICGLMVGDGPLRQDCEREAARVGAPIRFTGFVNQSVLPTIYEAADALVMQSENETWGIVVNEAMASSRPAFLSDGVGCGPDLIREGKTGVTFRVGDVEALSRLLIQYGSREKLQEMGILARQRVESFSTVVAVDGFIQAIKYATVSGRRRSFGWVA